MRTDTLIDVGRTGHTDVGDDGLEVEVPALLGLLEVLELVPFVEESGGGPPVELDLLLDRLELLVLAAGTFGTEVELDVLAGGRYVTVTRKHGHALLNFVAYSGAQLLRISDIHRRA